MVSQAITKWYQALVSLNFLVVFNVVVLLDILFCNCNAPSLKFVLSLYVNDLFYLLTKINSPKAIFEPNWEL